MADSDALSPKVSEHLHSILTVLGSHTRRALRHYRPSTLRRGIKRRMALHHLEDSADYLDLIRDSPGEARQLIRDLAGCSGGFFREPRAFQALERHVIADLARDQPAGEPLRIWVPGCAAGEDAYAIAMLLLEHLEALRKPCPVKIFATEIDQETVAFARAGIYPQSQIGALPPARLQRFFVHQAQAYRVAKRLRQAVVFSVHDLGNDPPFSKLDLISCRDRLSRFKPEFRRQLTALFHFALNEGGYLFLGRAAAAVEAPELFEPLAAGPWRLYRRKAAPGSLNRSLIAIRRARRATRPMIPLDCAGEPVREPPLPDPAAPAAVGDGATQDREDTLVRRLQSALARSQEQLQGTFEDHYIVNEELRTANEEIISANAELQALNEELETSKEELQALNDELIRLNDRLQEKVKALEAVTDDLANLLDSTAIPTLFLDTRFRIRRFTPAIRQLLNLIEADLRRPIADIAPKFEDGALLADAAWVLRDLAPREAEVHTGDGRWYIRRILPYRTQDHRIDGVVVTFIEITERKQAELALRAAKEEAEQANQRKSRFLAAVNHDLRQPLQALMILNRLLAGQAATQDGLKFVHHQGEAIRIMTDVLAGLLDLGKLEAGATVARRTQFPVADLFSRMRSEFEPQAQDKGVALRIVPCGALLHSDPLLLERIIQNLLANALKHAQAGKVLLGCRRRADQVRIEVWDNGIGIPQAQQQAIFEEFVQLDNPGRDRSKGLGLGLAIVDRLAHLLGHAVEVRSYPGKGSRFAVAVPRIGSSKPPAEPSPREQPLPRSPALLQGSIVLIEDETMIVSALRLLLEPLGLRLVAAVTADEALGYLQAHAVRPDLIIADYRLPVDETGVQAVQRLRRVLGRAIPAILLTGDTALGPDRAEGLDYLVLHKPVDNNRLIALICRLILDQDSAPRSLPAAASAYRRKPRQPVDRD